MSDDDIIEAGVEGAAIGAVFGLLARRVGKALQGPEFPFLYVKGHPWFPTSDSRFATHHLIVGPDAVQYTRGRNRDVTFDIPRWAI